MTTPDFRKQNILNGDSAVSNNHGTGVRCFYPASEKRKQAPSQQAQPADQSGTAHTQLIFTQKAVYATTSYKNTSHAFCQKCPAPTFPLTLSFSSPSFLLPFSICLSTPHSFSLL